MKNSKGNLILLISKLIYEIFEENFLIKSRIN